MAIPDDLNRYYCPECGGEDHFYQDNEVTETVYHYGARRDEVYPSGELRDYGELDCVDEQLYDSEITQSGDVICSDCDSTAVWLDDLDTDELEEIFGEDDDDEELTDEEIEEREEQNRRFRERQQAIKEKEDRKQTYVWGI